MADDKLRERIERLVAPWQVRDAISGRTREISKFHVRVRDLRRILDLHAVPDLQEALAEGAAGGGESGTETEGRG